MNPIKSICTAISLVLFCLGTALTANSAFADECETIMSDKNWNESIQLLTDLVASQKYDEAKALARYLNERCTRSPLMNYVEGKMAENEGNLDEAKFFYQKAAEYTYQFAVSPEVAKRIWYARYEFEYPERSEAGIQKLAAEKADMTAQIAASNEALALIKAQAEKNLEKEYKLAMWMGTGIGVAGLALTATGLALIATLDDSQKYTSSTPSENYVISNKYNAYWTVFGLGVAATVSGAILAGIFGYKLSALDDSTTLSFQLAPNRAALSMTF